MFSCWCCWCVGVTWLSIAGARLPGVLQRQHSRPDCRAAAGLRQPPARRPAPTRRLRAALADGWQASYLPGSQSTWYTRAAACCSPPWESGGASSLCLGCRGKAVSRGTAIWPTQRPTPSKPSQKIMPQLRQWCWRRRKVNSLLHDVQCVTLVPSCQVAAALLCTVWFFEVEKRM